MSAWYIFSIYLHVVLAAFWIGGMLFLPLVLLPSIKSHPDRITLLYKTGIQFRFFGWIALVLLLITGFGNLYFRGLPITFSFFAESAFGNLVILKLLLFILILLISGVHDFYIGKKALEDHIQGNNLKLRMLARWTGRINLIIALSLAFIGVALSRGWY